MIILILILMLINVPFSYAEFYAVKRSDGVTVIDYNEYSNDSLEDVLKEFGLSGLPVFRVSEKEVQNTISDSKYREIANGKLVINTQKKQEDLDNEAQKELEKEAVLSKLKISKEEFEKLK